MLSLVERMERSGQVLRIFEQLSLRIMHGEQQITGKKFFRLCGLEAVIQIRPAERFYVAGLEADMRQAGLSVFATLIQLNELVVVNLDEGHGRLARVREFECLLKAEVLVEGTGLFIVAHAESNMGNAGEVGILRPQKLRNKEP